MIAVLTRNEHYPPHVHVGSAQWEVRFEYSFWHNGVCLWDVVPLHERPNVAVVEGLRQALKNPLHLRRARECWWHGMQTLCLKNQVWDAQRQEVAAPQERRPDAQAIQSAVFDTQLYRTILQVKGARRPVEIEL